MKRILITGANSYVGTSFEKWMQQYPEYEIDTIDMIDGSWHNKSFAGYHAILHVAGLAHADITNVSEKVKKKYYAVNCDMAIETARKAKADGVQQFIFMSSMSVYGESAPVGKKRIITAETPTSPANVYGGSKIQAEKGLLELSDENFKVVILRPPMVYGKGSKGNFPTLEKFAKTLPIFPAIKNERSMIFINNLCEFVQLAIQREISGIFYPQNEEYVVTCKMVEKIAAEHHKRIWVTPIFNWAIYLISITPGKYGKLCNKAFGSFVYEKDLSEGPIKISEYQTVDFETSIRLTRTEEEDERA
jgi:UDP-glucose 4-epimerase